jgi:hypothetical protein
MNYLITAMEMDPRTHILSFVVRATVPVGIQARLVNPAAVGLYPAMDAADLQDLKDGKIAERLTTLDMTVLTTGAAAAEAVKIQEAFQAEVSGGGLNRWPLYGTQYNGSAWE